MADFIIGRDPVFLQCQNYLILPFRVKYRGRIKRDNMAIHETDQVIEDFLGDSPRATEWRAMRQALADRLTARRQQRREEADAGADEPRLHALDLQIAALERQVTALKTEEAVTQFVEDSIKVTLAKAQPEMDEEM
jgi:hypothetical protein